MDKHKISISEDELWKEIQLQIQPVKSLRKTRIERAKQFLGKPAYLVAGFVIIVMAVLAGFWKDRDSQADMTKVAIFNEVPPYPVVENVDNPDVTVMTYLTDDPKIKIVWLFED